MHSLLSIIRQTSLRIDPPQAVVSFSERPVLVVVPEHRRDGQTEELIQELSAAESEQFLLVTPNRAEPVWSFVRRLRRAVLDSGPISVVPSGEVSLLLSVALPLVLGRFFGRKVCLDLRAPLFYSLLEEPGHIDLFILRQASQILVNSPEEAHWLKRRGIRALSAPLIASTASYPVRTIKEVQPHLLVPAYSGDMVNLTSLIKAFRLVKAKYPRAEMALLMLEDLSGEVDRLCRIEQVPSVSFVDAYLAEEIRRGFAEADLFLNISLGGDHAGTVTRALMSGLPIVSADSIWARSFMDRPDWYLAADPNSPGQLADALIELIESPDSVAQLALRSRAAGARLIDALLD